jgi:hypothetical protein
MSTNPFTERGRIVNPERFVGRWNVLSLLFDRIEAGRAVLITGAAGIGKSSLLTHVVQSAAVNFEMPTLHAFYLDLVGAQSAAQIYQTLTEGLNERGDTQAALEVALATAGAPTLVCLDNAQHIASHEWGQHLLEALIRMARSGGLMLVVAIAGAAPPLSERFATIGLGAFSQSEVRLLAEAYLEGDQVQFSPADLRRLGALSAAHPAYLQRAAYHLYRAKLNPEVRWVEEYLAEARDRPIPGAPLPPSAFQGERADGDPSVYDELSEGEAVPAGPQPFQLSEPPTALLYLLPIALGLLLGLLGQPLAGVGLAALGSGALWLVLRRFRDDQMTR